jgi:malonyl CoA-acyl carrier protein transacylase/phosphopantetheinyl transferase
LCVLRAEDREGLREQAERLADFLTRHTHVSLKDLAFTLNSDLADAGSRLAVLAGSVAELRSRLTHAAERLADPKCRQIQDTQGIYYYDEPLHPQGKLAVIFPGEGAQYVHMFADLLPHFPEVRDHFTRCDALSISAGRRHEPITRAIFALPSATAEELAAAETNLWRLGNAVSSILISEWAIYILLRSLGLRPDVIGGHSAGEFSALLAAGCLEPDDYLISQLMSLAHVLQQQEDHGTVADAVLLAVATGRIAAADTVEQSGVPQGTVFVAMDNCPHQTVLVGYPDAMDVVESVLKRRGVMCERLPFHRPYHTPLFEPLLGPIAQMYERLPLRAPHTPVYSCTTGQLFPADAESIRGLAVAHWASTVEFVRMIENMHADGVRLFVEAGPRGNLTAFAADTLRGKPFAAVAANQQRRSGLTQLNHLAGQLAAHGVPLNLGHLYLHREARRIRLDSHVPVPLPEVKQETVEDPLARGEADDIGHGHGHANAAVVLGQYWDVMDQFLATQREVTEQFLTRRSGGLTTSPPHHLTTPPSRFPLLGDIIRLEPGRELVMRRSMDLNEDLYALDHTLGGRDASALDPDLHGLPVMPMAFSMEMMAEAAAVLVPDKLLVGMKRVRLNRWIPFDDDPITLEVTASALRSDQEEEHHVRVEIRDLGNANRPASLRVEPGAAPAVDGVMVFADRYPDAPASERFALSHERPCEFTVDQLYKGERRLFHGPLFQAVCSTDRQGDEGIEGHLRTLPHTGLLRSTSEPNLLTDPLLIDASTHILGAWHLSRKDKSGRVVFPYELGSVALFGPQPALDTLVKCQVRIERMTARQVSHRIDLIAPDGRLWCRLHLAEYWRFYWPQEYVDFFRFKDYLVGQPWAAVEEASIAAAAFAHRSACCTRVIPAADVAQPVKRAALAHISLSRAEWQQFRALKGPDRRITEWVFGRLAAKDAVRTLWQQRHGEMILPADLEIEPDANGRPVARRLDGAAELPTVSISHSDGVVAALAAFEPHVGIDLERIRHREPGFEEIAFDAAERALLDRCGFERDEAIARLWCAKEAVGKALGRGLAEGPGSVTVRSLDADGTARAALGPLLAAAFPDCRVDLLVVYTVRDGDFVVATTFCERDKP